jgi:quinol monooxygenase YgiN
MKDYGFEGLSEVRQNTYTMFEEFKSLEALQEHLKKPYVVDLIGFLSNHGIKFQAKLYQCV